jgi:hypothetical protein
MVLLVLQRAPTTERQSLRIISIHSLGVSDAISKGSTVDTLSIHSLGVSDAISKGSTVDTLSIHSLGVSQSNHQIIYAVK